MWKPLIPLLLFLLLVACAQMQQNKQPVVDSERQISFSDWIRNNDKYESETCYRKHGVYGNSRFCFYDSTQIIDLSNFRFLLKENGYVAYIRKDLLESILGVDFHKNGEGAYRELTADAKRMKQFTLDAASNDRVCIVKWPTLRCLTDFKYKRSSVDRNYRITTVSYIGNGNTVLFSDTLVLDYID